MDQSAPLANDSMSLERSWDVDITSGQQTSMGASISGNWARDCKWAGGTVNWANLSKSEATTYIIHVSIYSKV